MLHARTLPPFLFTGTLLRVVYHLPEFARLYVRLFRDPRVPRWTKAVLVLTVLYWISPIDLVPAFIPILGQLDDLGVVLGGLWLFVRLCPRDVVAETVRDVARSPAR